MHRQRGFHTLGRLSGALLCLSCAGQPRPFEASDRYQQSTSSPEDNDAGPSDAQLAETSLKPDSEQDLELPNHESLALESAPESPSPDLVQAKCDLARPVPYEECFAPWRVDHRSPRYSLPPHSPHVEGIEKYRAALANEVNQDRRAYLASNYVRVLDDFALLRQIDCEDALDEGRELEARAAREDFVRTEREANRLMIEFFPFWTRRGNRKPEQQPVQQYWIAVRAHLVGDDELALQYFDRALTKLTPSHGLWARALLSSAKVALILGSDEVESRLESVEAPANDVPFERWLPHVVGYAVSRCVSAELAEARGAPGEALNRHKDLLNWLQDVGYFRSKDELMERSKRAIQRLSL